MPAWKTLPHWSVRSRYSLSVSSSRSLQLFSSSSELVLASRAAAAFAISTRLAVLVDGLLGLAAHQVTACAPARSRTASCSRLMLSSMSLSRSWIGVVQRRRGARASTVVPGRHQRRSRPPATAASTASAVGLPCTFSRRGLQLLPGGDDLAGLRGQPLGQRRQLRLLLAVELGQPQRARRASTSIASSPGLRPRAGRPAGSARARARVIVRLRASSSTFVMTYCAK